MLRSLFLEYPDDPGSWLIDDEYMFGSDLLVAPMVEEAAERNVYLPPGAWIDYQTGKVYRGGWQRIAPGQIPVILLVKDHSAIPHIKIAQSTAEMDWKNIELRVFSSDTSGATGLFSLPQGKPEQLRLESDGKSYRLKNDPEQGAVNWRISSAR